MRLLPKSLLDPHGEAERFESALNGMKTGDVRSLRSYLLLLAARDPMVRNAVADSLATLTDDQRESLFAQAGFTPR